MNEIENSESLLRSCNSMILSSAYTDHGKPCVAGAGNVTSLNLQEIVANRTLAHQTLLRSCGISREHS